MQFIRKNPFVIPLVIVAGLFLYFITNTFLTSEQRFFDAEIDKLDITYGEVLDTYSLLFSVVFSEIINQPDVLELYSGAYPGDEAERDAIRADLYALLSPMYERLAEVELRQLHFHLPDDVSFLRFHRPERYGDDLTGVRYTVTKANTEQVVVEGFEEGRIYNGFRYVYPLAYEGDHIGTVETSVSFNALRNEMNNQLPGEVSFMLSAEVIGVKVFEDEQDNYSLSDLSDDYLYDNEMLSDYAEDAETVDPLYTWERIQEVDAAINPRLADKLPLGEPFGMFARIAGSNYTVSFLPVYNAQDVHVGYIMGYSPGDFIWQNRINYGFTMLITVASFVMLGLFWYSRAENTRLVEANNKKLTVLNKDLAEARDQAQAADRMKSEFLANMSHELRTPLNAIINFNEFVITGIEGEINERQADKLKQSVESAEHLLSMINDIMDASKIEAGEMDFFMEPSVSVFGLLKSSVGMAEGLVSHKPVTIERDLQKGMAKIKGDRRRLKQVFLNVLSNAAKFTEEGKITVKAEQKGDNILVTIADTGSGIAADEQHLVFERFHQTTSGRDKQGSGLGMPISKFFVDAHDGKIWFESVEGKGTTFYVELPINKELAETEATPDDEKVEQPA